MARKHPVEIPPPSPSSSEEEGNTSSEEEQEEVEEDKANNTNAGKDDEEDTDETEEEEEDSDDTSSSEEDQEEEEVKDGTEEDKVKNAIACKDDEDDDDETEEEEEEEGSDSDSDSESESDLLSPSPSAFKLERIGPPPLPTSENGKAAVVRKKVKAETLKIEADGEVGGEKIEANGRVKRKIDVDADKNMWEKYPLLDASLNEMESESRAGGALLLRQSFGLIGKSSMDELEREWKKLKQDEVKLFSRRNALIAKQVGLFLDHL